MTVVVVAKDTAGDMSEERMSEGDGEMFKLPVVGEMSSSGGISTTLSPTKRKKRRKKVKIKKTNETPNILKGPLSANFRSRTVHCRQNITFDN